MLKYVYNVEINNHSFATIDLNKLFCCSRILNILSVASSVIYFKATKLSIDSCETRLFIIFLLKFLQTFMPKNIIPAWQSKFSWSHSKLVHYQQFSFIKYVLKQRVKLWSYSTKYFQYRLFYTVCSIHCIILKFSPLISRRMISLSVSACVILFIV